MKYSAALARKLLDATSDTARSAHAGSRLLTAGRSRATVVTMVVDTRARPRNQAATLVVAFATILVAFPAAAVPAAAQLPDTARVPASRAERLTGIYRFADGTAFHVLDLRDQLNGRVALSLTEYASGRVRALYPRDDGSFEAGNGWFTHGSVEYRVRFDERDGRATRAAWTENGTERTATRVPLVEREARVLNGDVELAGTLVLPPGAGRHPVIVMIPGSGPLTRRTPRQMGDLFAMRGVGILVMDKRGTGASSGHWTGLSHRAWATDVEAQLDWLKRQPGVDTTRIGLYAASEGGFVAPIVASHRADVRFLVCRVCSALPQSPVIIDMERNAMRARGAAEADVAKAMELLSRLQRFALDGTGYDSLVAYAASGNGTSWRREVPLDTIPARDATYWRTYRGMLDVDPAEYYRMLHIPILVVLGEADDRILAARHSPVFRSFNAPGRDVTVWVIPGASHGLLLGANGSGGYPPGLHDRIATWVAETAARAGAG